MLALAVIALTIAHTIGTLSISGGVFVLRDDELAAASSALRSSDRDHAVGRLMGMAGAPFPYYIGYLQPSSAFGLEYAVNSIAMPIIGGTASWAGPLIGAILLGTLQQYVTVTISSSVNVLIVGVLLVAFVVVAPNGIMGLFQSIARRLRNDRKPA
jgi:branched-chain amino acid transport system permease protein